MELDKCRPEIVPGPFKRMHWGIPDGARDSYCNLVHDDYLITAASALAGTVFQRRA